MADYVPSAVIVVGSLLTIGILYAIRVPLLVIAILAMFAFLYVLGQHQDLFAMDYRVAHLLNTFTSYAPFIIISSIIFISLGYIFFIRGVTKGPRLVTGAPISNSNLYSFTPQSPAAPPPIASAPTNRQGINRALNSLTNRNRENLFRALERAV